MTFRELSVPGAWELTPAAHGDARGTFFEWFADREFTAMTGHRLDLHQANVSVSSAGVLRGLHFAELPPSQAKYVTCLRGAVFDVVVDVRVGSPDLRPLDSLLLDDRDHRTVYLSEGPGARIRCTAGSFDGGLPVRRATPPTASTPSWRPTRRCASNGRSTLRCCRIATPRHRRWPRSGPPACCRRGRDAGVRRESARTLTRRARRRTPLRAAVHRY